MLPCAHLTLLWGETPIGPACVAPGQAVGITDAGAFAPASRPGSAALWIRMHRRGATVSRRGGAAQRADRCWLSESADVRIAIAAPCAAHADRRGGAWEPTPVALRIAVTSLDPVPLRRPARTGRGLRAAALSAAAHAAALVIAATTMPRLEAIEDDFLFDTFAPALRRHVPSVDEEDSTPDEDGFGRAPEVCAELQPTRGHAIAVRGPTDNPDPHIARQRAPFDDLTLDVIGPLRGPMGADELAPVLPWGRDDSLGADAFSATGSTWGHLSRDLLATCFGDPPAIWTSCGYDAPPGPPTLAELGLAGVGHDRKSPEATPRRRVPRRVPAAEDSRPAGFALRGSVVPPGSRVRRVDDDGRSRPRRPPDRPVLAAAHRTRGSPGAPSPVGATAGLTIRASSRSPAGGRRRNGAAP
jgi:hypothetical protein